MRAEDARSNYIKYFLHYDADDSEEEEEPHKRGNAPQTAPQKQEPTHYGNTRLPYGLCKEAGIDTTGMEPHEAWETLEGKTGVSHDKALKQVRETGTAEGIVKEIKESAPNSTTNDAPKEERPQANHLIRNDPDYKYWTEGMKQYERVYDGLENLRDGIKGLMSSDGPFWETELPPAPDTKEMNGFTDALDGEYEAAEFKSPAYEYYGGLWRDIRKLNFGIKIKKELAQLGDACREIQELRKTGTKNSSYLAKLESRLRTASDILGANLRNECTYLMIGHPGSEVGDKLFEKIERDVNSVIGPAREDVENYGRLLGLFSGMFDVDVCDENDISGGIETLKNSKFAKKYPEETQKTVEGLEEYHKIVGGVVSKINEIYSTEATYKEKAKMLQEYRRDIWDIRDDIVDGKTKLVNDSSIYRDALIKTLEDLTCTCSMNHLDRINGPTPNYANMGRGKYDSVKVSKDNTVEGAFIKFDESCFSEERKNNAVWCSDVGSAIDTFGKWTKEAFKHAPLRQRRSLYNYTYGSGHCNRPLSGYFFDGAQDEDTERKWGLGYYAGAGNGDLNIEGGKEDIDNVTEFLKNTRLQQDTWVQRGVSMAGAMALFGLNEITEESLNAMAATGRLFQQKSFMSCGASKGTGFDGEDIILNVYCPAETQAGYIAPVSYFGGNKHYSGGSIHISGNENEMLIQRNSIGRVTKAKKSPDGKRLYVDIEIVAQAPYDYNKK